MERPKAIPPYAPAYAPISSQLQENSAAEFEAGLKPISFSIIENLGDEDDEDDDFETSVAPTDVYEQFMQIPTPSHKGFEEDKPQFKTNKRVEKKRKSAEMVR